MTNSHYFCYKLIYSGISHFQMMNFQIIAETFSISPQVLDLACWIIKFPPTSIIPELKAIQFFLCDIPTLLSMDSVTQLHVICTLDYHTLIFYATFAKENIK